MSQHPISKRARRLRLLGFLIQNFGPAIGSPDSIDRDIVSIASYVAGTANLAPDQSRNRVEHFVTNQILVGYANYIKNLRRQRGRPKMAFHTDRPGEIEVIGEAYLLYKLSIDAWSHLNVNQRILNDLQSDIAEYLDLVTHGMYVQFMKELFEEVELFFLRLIRRSKEKV